MLFTEMNAIHLASIVSFTLEKITSNFSGSIHSIYK